jgi:hypothetical protein
MPSANVTIIIKVIRKSSQVPYKTQDIEQVIAEKLAGLQK